MKLVSPESVGLSTSRLDAIPPHLNRYVDNGQYPGYQILVARRGQAAYFHQYGLRDVEAGLPVEENTLFRIYSMTKPITSVALLQLYERGLFQLNDPISRMIPQFKELVVYKSGEGDRIETEPAARQVTFRDLLTHTAGFSYGNSDEHPVDALYQKAEVLGGTLEEMIGRLAALPLLFSPGTRWRYSVATDIIGYLIEVISGRPLASYLREQIFEPLGMVDTGFHVPAAKVERFAANYRYHRNDDGRDGMTLIDAPGASKYLAAPALPSGGGGLVSTAADYLRFSQMLLNRGTLDGTRILGRKTVELMTSNHMPDNSDLASMGQAVFSETSYHGIGFGLGVSVLLDPAAAQILGSRGEYSWGGAASTAFWIDPVEEQIVIFLTQLMPSNSYPIGRELRVLTYQAIEE